MLMNEVNLINLTYFPGAFYLEDAGLIFLCLVSPSIGRHLET